MTNLNDEDKNKKESKIPKKEEKKELSIEEKLKDTEDKLLRSLAELENQRKRFDKDIKEAIEFGGFSFAKENLAILDNLQRDYISIKNDPALKDNKEQFAKAEAEPEPEEGSDSVPTDNEPEPEPEPGSDSVPTDHESGPGLASTDQVECDTFTPDSNLVNSVRFETDDPWLKQKESKSD